MPMSNYFLRRIGYEDDRLEDVPLQMGKMEFGRTNKSYKKVVSTYASRTHCVISIEGEVVKIRDYNTSNGTFINGRMLKNGEKVLKTADIIGLGCVVDAIACAADNKYVMYRLCHNVETINLLDEETAVNCKFDCSSVIGEAPDEIDEYVRIKEETLDLNGYLESEHKVKMEPDDIICIEDSDSDSNDSNASKWKEKLSQSNFSIDGGSKIKIEPDDVIVELSDSEETPAPVAQPIDFLQISDSDESRQTVVPVVPTRKAIHKRRRSSVRILSCDSDNEPEQYENSVKQRSPDARRSPVVVANDTNSDLALVSTVLSSSGNQKSRSTKLVSESTKSNRKKRRVSEKERNSSHCQTNEVKLTLPHLNGELPSATSKSSSAGARQQGTDKSSDTTIVKAMKITTRRHTIHPGHDTAPKPNIHLTSVVSGNKTTIKPSAKDVAKTTIQPSATLRVPPGRAAKITSRRHTMIASASSVGLFAAEMQDAAKATELSKLIRERRFSISDKSKTTNTIAGKLVVGPKDLNSIIDAKRMSAVDKSKPLLIAAKPLEKRRKSISVENTKLLLKANDLKSGGKCNAKPSTVVPAQRQKPIDSSIKEIRKSKLKDLAEASKMNGKSDQKTCTKPKVKVTHKNRGAFLTDESHQPPLPNVKKPTKNVTVAVNGLSKSSNEPDSGDGGSTLADLDKLIDNSIKTTKSPLPRIPKLLNASAKAGEVVTSPIEIPSRVNNSCDRLRISHATKKTHIAEPSSSSSTSLLNGLLNIINGVPPAPIPPPPSTVLPTNKELDRFTFLLKPVQVKSILSKKYENPIKQKPKRSVRFDDTPQLRWFTKDPAEDLIHVGVEKDIVTDITSWLPVWLDVTNPPVNGDNHILLPLMQTYPDFESFYNIMYPVMKVELWHRIADEYMRPSEAKPNIDVTLNDINYEKRGTGHRQVFHCELSHNYTKLAEQDFVIVTHGSGGNIYEFFALVTDLKYTKNRPNQSVFFIMEAAMMAANKNVTRSTKITIKQVSCLKLELKEFKSLINLRESPLLPNILQPILNAIDPSTVAKTVSYAYNGPDTLNEEQADILRQVFLRCKPLAKPCISLIDGPPGTGKSRLISNLVMQIFYNSGMRKGHKILVCAHSNAAIDVIAKKLMKIQDRITNAANKKFILVRFGRFDSVDTYVQRVTVERLSKGPDPPELINERNLLNLQLKAICFSGGKNAKQNDKQMLENKMRIVKEKICAIARQRTDDNIYTQTLNGADIICTTLNSCFLLQTYITDKSVPICIVDEATQCTEPSTSIPLQFGVRSLVLVGDTKQLPAFVKSQEAEKHGLKISLFHRMQLVFGEGKPNPVYRLCRQYRMVPEICEWSNEFFYDNRLVTENSTMDPTFPFQPYTLFSLESTQSNVLNRPLHMISNASEADFVVGVLKVLAPIINDRYSVGIITPYTYQKNELASKLCAVHTKYISVNTIDAYQGQEKDIIIISNARSNGIGFLSEPQRLNVALTRARKSLILCGNYRELSRNRMWNELLKNAEHRHKIHHVDGRMDIDSQHFSDFITKVLVK